MEARMKEIMRCTRVSNIDDIKTSNNDAQDLTVKTNNRNAFKILKNNKKWPKNAFIEGVEVSEYCTHLEVKVINFETTRTVAVGSILERKLNEVGLVEITRVRNPNGSDKNVIRAKAKTIAHFIELCKFGIQLDPKVYKVEPFIRFSSPCSRYGNLNHGPKNCSSSNPPKCLNCGTIGHTKADCMSNNFKPCCVNCKGKHTADNDICPILRNKVIQNNSFILKLILGEDVKKNTDFMFKNKEDESLNDKAEIKNYIDKHIE